MGEQHLPKLLEQACFSVIQGEGHIPQGQPHHIPALLLPDHQGNQGGLRRNDGMPCPAGNAIPVPGGAGGGIGHAPGGKQYGFRFICRSIHQQSPAAAVLQEQIRHLPRNHLHPQPTAFLPQGEDNLSGAVADRKYPVAPLGFQPNPQGFKKFHHIRRTACGKGTI